MSDRTFIKEDGTTAMTWCHKCKRENYAACVMSGQCAWCGHKTEGAGDE